jgi:Bacterial Ig domain
MTPRHAPPSEVALRVRVRVGVGILVVAVLAACTGDNLFTGLAISNQLTGPVVNITSPGANQTVAVGAPVTVTAHVTSSQGVSQMVFSGVFAGGSAAFTSQTFQLPNPKDTTLTTSLQQAGTSTGSAEITVQATDILGATGADTVGITINP